MYVSVWRGRWIDLSRFVIKKQTRAATHILEEYQKLVLAKLAWESQANFGTSFSQPGLYALAVQVEKLRGLCHSFIHSAGGELPGMRFLQ